MMLIPMVLFLGGLFLVIAVVFYYPQAVGTIEQSILIGLGIILVLAGTVLTFATMGYSYRERPPFYVVLRYRIPQLFFHGFFTILLLLNLWMLAIFLLFPHLLWTAVTGTVNDVQILGCIATSGMLGGLIRQLRTNLKPVEISVGDKSETEKPTEHGEAEEKQKADAPKSYYVKFWSAVYSILSAVFISVILFLLLRAGILRTVQVDTFNVYGVTGVAAIAGYFAENIIGRFTDLYEQVLGRRHDS